MENIPLQFNGEPLFALRISSEVATTGNIIVPTTNLTIPFEVPARATEIALPDAIWFSELSQVIDNKGILIETPTSIEWLPFMTAFTSLMEQKFFRKKL